MLNTNVYSYINVLDKAADAGWIRNQAIVNNISNKDTPGYKREDVAFESQLQKALGRNQYESLNSKVTRVNSNLNRLNPSPYIDNKNYSYRLDGNNVDPENEQVMLVENQLKYQGLIEGITAEFQNLQTVMK